jgi:hypothetical protein
VLIVFALALLTACTSDQPGTAPVFGNFAGEWRVIWKLARARGFLPGRQQSCPRHALPPDGLESRDLLAARVQSMAEPFQLFFAPAEIAAELTAFQTVEDLDPTGINARYFTHRADQLSLVGGAVTNQRLGLAGWSKPRTVPIPIPYREHAGDPLCLQNGGLSKFVPGLPTGFRTRWIMLPQKGPDPANALRKLKT